jgi:hypothetical protein
MAKLHKQLNTAANTIGGDGDSINRRLRAMERTLKDVESLPSMTNSELPILENNQHPEE